MSCLAPVRVVHIGIAWVVFAVVLGWSLMKIGEKIDQKMGKNRRYGSTNN